MQQHAEAIDNGVSPPTSGGQQIRFERHVYDIHDRGRGRQGQINYQRWFAYHAEARRIDEQSGMPLDIAHLAPGMDGDPRRRRLEVPSHGLSARACG